MDRQSVELWLRSHRAGERSFQRALREFFQGQAERVADALADFDEITPAVVPQVFQPEVEAERLQPVLNRHLRQLLALGASDELSIVEAVRTPDKALGGNLLADLPEMVLARIRQALTELEGQDYWQAIQAETETRLAEIIRIGIDQEASNYQIGIRIREHLGGMPANRRAQKIARTEVTASYREFERATRGSPRRTGC